MDPFGKFTFDQNFLQAYHAWRANPVTQRMLLVAKAFIKPGYLPPGSQTGERALYYAGRIDGASVITDILENLDDYVEQRKTAARAESELKEAEYGCDGILKDSAYG